jgi:hypothetical protein
MFVTYNKVIYRSVTLNKTVMKNNIIVSTTHTLTEGSNP